MDLKELTNRVKALLGKRSGGGGTTPDGGDLSGAQPGGGPEPSQPDSSQTPPTGADRADATATQPGTPDDGLDADAPDADAPGGVDRNVGEPGGGQTP